MNLSALFSYMCIVVILLYNFSHWKAQKELPGGRFRKWAARKRLHSSGDSFFLSDNLWTGVEIYIVCVFQYAPVLFLNQSFGNLVGTGANYFGLLYFIPFIFSFGCFLICLNPAEQMDLVTPAFPFALIFVKLCCFVDGCCKGIPWEKGWPNAYTGRLEFPVQLLESGVALLIFLGLLATKKRMKPGTVFPTYLMVYSGIRFFTEFLRGEEAVFGVLKRYHILCLLGVLLGIMEYGLAKTFCKRFVGKP